MVWLLQYHCNENRKLKLDKNLKIKENRQRLLPRLSLKSMVKTDIFFIKFGRSLFDAIKYPRKDMN